jgi:hypothetical protein
VERADGSSLMTSSIKCNGSAAAAAAAAGWHASMSRSAVHATLQQPVLRLEQELAVLRQQAAAGGVPGCSGSAVGLLQRLLSTVGRTHSWHHTHSSWAGQRCCCCCC